MHTRTSFPRKAAAPAVKPRNPVVMAMARRFGSQHARSALAEQRSRERFEDLDLDQRVREVGEW